MVFQKAAGGGCPKTKHEIVMCHAKQKGNESRQNTTYTKDRSRTINL
jgi:hypothetical protein